MANKLIIEENSNENLDVQKYFKLFMIEMLKESDEKCKNIFSLDKDKYSFDFDKNLDEDLCMFVVEKHRYDSSISDTDLDSHIEDVGKVLNCLIILNNIFKKYSNEYDLEIMTFVTPNEYGDYSANSITFMCTHSSFRSFMDNDKFMNYLKSLNKVNNFNL